jgi:hypothetical protein
MHKGGKNEVKLSTSQLIIAKHEKIVHSFFLY